MGPGLTIRRGNDLAMTLLTTSFRSLMTTSALGFVVTIRSTLSDRKASIFSPWSSQISLISCMNR